MVFGAFHNVFNIKHPALRQAQGEHIKYQTSSRNFKKLQSILNFSIFGRLKGVECLNLLNPIYWKNNTLRIIDQTKLPMELEEVTLTSVKEVWDAIKKLKVRGAPAIGIAAGYGVVLSALSHIQLSLEEFVKKIRKDIDYLKTSRPTAVNLFLILDQFVNLIESVNGNNEEILDKIKRLAIAVHEDDKERCNRIGEFGQELISDSAIVLTHCNTGTLATGGIGTALGIIYTAVEKGKQVKVFVDETRPLLQGSRLTAYELNHAHINATLISDNMAASVMANNKIDAILVGADRIATNGDTANKIGTYGLAVLAKYHKIPFYIVAPLTTFDLETETGKEIPIEEREYDEVRKIKNSYISPEKINVYNPAFDITPHELITGIITDQGIINEPDEEKIKELYKKIQKPIMNQNIRSYNNEQR